MVAWFNFTSKLSLPHSPEDQSFDVQTPSSHNITAFDLIGDLSFGENFGCLDNGDYHPFVRSIQAISKELTFAQMLRYYGILGLRQYFIPKGVSGARAENMKRAVQTVQTRIQKVTDRKDFLHYILAANEEKAMTPAEIHVNAFSLSIAGSESTATALCGATYEILSHPEVYKKLTAEIRGTFKSEGEIALSSINGLEYLDAVLNETLRNYPPVAITLPRVVPPGGETIDGSYVPAGTTVGVNHFSSYHHPQNFHRASEFLPERWLVKSESVGDASPFAHDNKPCMQPFSFGPRNCLGKNLARAEMRLIMAKLLWMYDLELVDGGKNWLEGQKIFGFWEKPPLMCRLYPVERH